MPTVGDLISSLWGKDMEILLATDHVVFRSGSKTESLEPVVYLSVAPGARRLLAVGGSSGLTEAFVSIHLFDGEPLRNQDLKKHEILEAFLRYGFAKLHNRSAFIRPRAIFYGTEAVAKAFGGYEQGVLEQAAVAAGAREVIIK